MCAQGFDIGTAEVETLLSTVFSADDPFLRGGCPAATYTSFDQQPGDPPSFSTSSSSAAVNIMSDAAAASVSRLVDGVDFFMDTASPYQFDDYSTTELQCEVVVRTEEFPCRICGK